MEEVSINKESFITFLLGVYGHLAFGFAYPLLQSYEVKEFAFMVLLYFLIHRLCSTSRKKQ